MTAIHDASFFDDDIDIESNLDMNRTSDILVEQSVDEFTGKGTCEDSKITSAIDGHLKDKDVSAADVIDTVSDINADPRDIKPEKNFCFLHPGANGSHIKQENTKDNIQHDLNFSGDSYVSTTTEGKVY